MSVLSAYLGLAVPLTLSGYSNQTKLFFTLGWMPNVDTANLININIINVTIQGLSRTCRTITNKVGHDYKM